MAKTKTDIIKIYYSYFDRSKINATGWMGKEGQMKLRLTDPLPGQNILDGVDIAIANNKYRYIGNLYGNNPKHSFVRLQNAFESHPLNNRSMMIGDIAIFEKTGYVVNNNGWKKLNIKQIKKLLKLKKRNVRSTTYKREKL